MIKNLRIPDPCQENWNGMQPMENGRYCLACQKVVVDFTYKSDQEIIDHIGANAGKKMCGTFKVSQLSQNNQQSTVQGNEKTIRFLAALLLVFGMPLFSCQDESQNLSPAAVVESPPAPPETKNVEDAHPAKEEIIKRTTCVPIQEVPESLIKEEIEMSAPDVIPDTNNIVVGMITGLMPEFKGGEAALREYLINNIHYPDIGHDSIQGTVYIAFTVRKDGSITDVKVLRGVGEAFDKEAIRVIKEMPAWTPGQMNGSNVDIQYNIPIKFRLR